MDIFLLFLIRLGWRRGAADSVLVPMVLPAEALLQFEDAALGYDPSSHWFIGLLSSFNDIQLIGNDKYREAIRLST